MRPARLVIFAKAPLPGHAKTRLIPALGAEGAARLAERLLAHTVEEAVQSGFDRMELCVTPSPTDPVWYPFLPLANHRQLVWSDQGPGGLGQRLARAAARLDSQGEAMLFIGTDTPALDATILNRSHQALAQHDAVLIPSTDGGYVLLGLQRFHPSVFSGISWSSPAVAAQTRLKLQALGLTWAELPALTDLDEPEDLPALPEHWQVKGV